VAAGFGDGGVCVACRPCVSRAAALLPPCKLSCSIKWCKYAFVVVIACTAQAVVWGTVVWGVGEQKRGGGAEEGNSLWSCGGGFGGGALFQRSNIC
jgi:hypothetical protein